MGDTSNFSLRVRDVTAPALRAAIRDAFMNYSGGYNHYHDEVDGDSITLGANDVSLGSVENLSVELDSIIAEGVEDVVCGFCKGEGEDTPGHRCGNCEGDGAVTRKFPDFRYWVNDEPKYEWMGSVIIHVPGMEDYVGSCDADGSPVMDGSALMDLVEKATDLDALKVELAQRTGSKHVKAFHDNNEEKQQ